MLQSAQYTQPSPLELVRTEMDQAFFVFHSGFVSHETGQTITQARKAEEKAAERAQALAYVASTVAENFGIAQKTRINPDNLPELVEVLGREALGNKLIIEFHTGERRRRSFPGLLELGRAIAKEMGEVDELRDVIEEEAPFVATDVVGDSPNRTRINY